MRQSLIQALGLVLLLAASGASAEPDAFGLGTGRDGVLSVRAEGVSVNAYARVSTTLGAGATAIPVASTEGFRNQDLVLVLQMTGVSSSRRPGDSERLVLSTESVGRWELARVATVSSRTLNLTRPLVNAFGSGATQVVRVPEYTRVTVERGASLVARPWDGSVGGVVAFLATGSVTNQGLIGAVGAGFRGGAYARDWSSAGGCTATSFVGSGGAQRGESVARELAVPPALGRGNDANGGGGGVCRQSGGGGGGNGGMGGQGGRTALDDGARDVGGMGGASLSYSLLEQLTLGGGGGAGHGLADPPGPDGGHGGGIIFFRATRLVGSGRVDASGERGGSSATDGAGGGGAGGSISVRLAESAECSGMFARGGAGGDSQGLGLRAPGGGGGGGRVLLQAESLSGCAVDVDAGRAGVSADGTANGALPLSRAVAPYQGTVELLEEGFSAPPAPSIVLPVEGSALRTSQPLFSGTARPGDEVILFVDEAEVGRTRADGSGAWSFVPEGLEEATWRLSAAALSAGAQGPRSEGRTFTVDVTAPETSVREEAKSLRADGRTFEFASPEAGVTFQCSLDDGPFNACRSPYRLTGLTVGEHSLRVRAQDQAGNVDLSPAVARFAKAVISVPVITAPTTNSYTTDTTPTFTGTSSTSGATVALRIDGADIGATIAVAGGNWSYTPAVALSEGVHTVQAEAVKDPDHSGFTAAVFFTIDSVAPAVPVVTTPSVNQVFATKTPTLTGTSADRTARVLVTIDTAAEVDAQVNPTTGAWSYTPSAQLTEAAHTVKVQARDAAGNNSNFSTTVAFSVDVTAPGIPTLSAPAQGLVTSNRRPTISGTADPGVFVDIYIDDGTAITVTAASPSGNWSYTPTADLSQALHWVRALARDAAGNISFFSTTRVFTIDASAPAAPVVTVPANGARLSSGTVVVQGTAEANATVSIALNTVNQGATVANPSGAWSFVIPMSVVETTSTAHSLSVIATDAANNSSSATTVSFWVDLTAPDTTITGTPSNPSNNVAQSFTFTSTEAGTFECSLNGAAFTSCTSPHTPAVSHSATAWQFAVRANDLAGNVDPSPAVFSWLVDTVAPSVPVVQVPVAGGYVTTTTPVISGTAEAGAMITVAIDGTNQATQPVADATGRWSMTTTALASGSRSVRASARDAAGNASAQSTAQSFTVDVTAPDTTITGTPSNPSNNVAQSFTFTSTEAGTFECSLNGAAFTSCTSPHTPAVSHSATAWQFAVRAKDLAGNVDSSPAVFSWLVDTVAPSVPVVQVPAAGGYVTTTTPVISGTAEAGAMITVAIDGTNQATQPVADATGRWSMTTTALASGSRSVRASARDAAGNASGQSAAQSFTVDVTAPDTTITGTPSNPSNNVAQSFTFTSTEAGTFECSLNGAPFATCTSPHTPAVSHSATAWQFAVRAKDLAGNVDPLPAVFSWFVDTVAPSVPVVQVPAAGDYVNTTTPVISGMADVGTTITVAIDGTNQATQPVADATGRWSMTTTALASGARSVRASARDAAGNVSAQSAAQSFTVDVTAPDTTITSGPPPSTNVLTASFTFTSNESDVTFECGLDGDAFTACPAAHSVTVMAEGAHVLRVRAKDRAGNVDPTPDQHSWRVDQAAIDTFIINKPTSPTNVATAHFKFGSNKSSVTYSCKLDAAAYVSCPEEYSVTVGSGSHTLLVRAKDSANNEDSSDATHTWLVDLDAPATPLITAPIPNERLDTSSPLIKGTAEANATVRVVIATAGQGTVRQGGVPVDASGAWSFSPSPSLADATYTVTATTVDGAGNESTATAPRTFIVDTSRPDTTIVTKPPLLSTTRVAEFTFSSNDPEATFKVSLDNGSRVTSGTSYSVTVSSEGNHTLSVQAVNATGTEDLTPATYSWTVDSVSPTISFQTKPPEVTNETTAKFNFTADESGVAFKCTLDGVVTDPCANPSTFTVADGEHTLAVQGKDLAGNTSNVITYAWRVDSNVPDTYILAKPDALITVPSATFRFGTNKDEVTRFECSLDNAAYAACGSEVVNRESTVLYQGLLGGNHVLRVKAVDNLGNADPTAAEWTWEVDLAPPTLELSSNWAGLVNRAITDPIVNVNTHEVQFKAKPTARKPVIIECKLGAAEYVACQEEFTLTLDDNNTKDDFYTLLVRVRYVEGGTLAPNPQRADWRVDTMKPIVPVITAPVQQGWVNESSALVKGTAEAGSQVYLSVDGHEQSTPLSVDGSGNWSVALSDLAEGAHTLTTRGVDGAQNASDASPERIFTVDRRAPVLTVAKAPEGRTRAAKETIQVTSDEEVLEFTCKLDSSVSSASCGTPVRSGDGLTATVNVDGLVEGSYTLQIGAKDRAGNTTSLTPPIKWRVYLGGDMRTEGGGLSCASAGGDGFSWPLVGLGGLALLAARRRRAR